jgi:peptide/bleomycin uptake transporter
MPAVIGLRHFYTGDMLWFYLYFFIVYGIFSSIWFIVKPHPFQKWSILGSGVIVFATFYIVQVSVAINNWRRPFFDLVQNSLGESELSTIEIVSELYSLIGIFASIALVYIVLYVINRFFVQHYIFRWRAAMHGFYMARWKKLRHIEGASQRIQEDTMRFASIMENLGVAFVDAAMTLFAFLPILWGLSQYVTELPIIGVIPKPLFSAIIFWAIFGTGLLAIVGIKLPGLEFRNQRVEAALRKELVHGEDDIERAKPPSIIDLFTDVRHNYFRLYFHYLYFNIARSFYLQADNIFGYFILIPTIALGKITFGILQQILTALGQVSNSFQFIVNSWPTIIELISIYKRLEAFEATLVGKALSDIDTEWVAEKVDK